MIIQDNTVICIKTNEELWDLFNDNYYIKEIPKRQQLVILNEGLLGHIFDVNVAPQFRKPEYFKSISLWATHMMALTKFVKEETQTWLLVIENTIDLGFIQEPKKGLTILAPGASAYIVDRETANIIVNNCLIYYNPFYQTLKDMHDLKLIDVHEKDLFPELKKNLFYIYFPFFLVLLFGLIVLFSPLYSIWTKSLVSLAEMTGSKEAAMSGKG